MAKHFNELTPAEAERLAILAEECAEVIQMVGKVLRHGYQSHNPFDPERRSNQYMLACELGHVEYIMKRMIVDGDVLRTTIDASVHHKGAKIGKYLHHQE